MKLILSLAFCLFSISLFAQEPRIVAQKDKHFSTQHLVIHKGDQVSFPNHDDIYHNVYSLSKVKTFDLGTYPKGETKLITFDKVGLVKVQCAIHSQMQMIIEVR